MIASHRAEFIYSSQWSMDKSVFWFFFFFCYWWCWYCWYCCYCCFFIFIFIIIKGYVSITMVSFAAFRGITNGFTNNNNNNNTTNSYDDYNYNNYFYFCCCCYLDLRFIRAFFVDSADVSSDNFEKRVDIASNMCSKRPKVVIIIGVLILIIIIVVVVVY